MRLCRSAHTMSYGRAQTARPTAHNVATWSTALILSFFLASLVEARGQQITSLQPSSVPVGSGAFTLTINGSGFSPPNGIIACAAGAQWNGTNVATTFVSPSRLTAQIPAS